MNLRSPAEIEKLQAANQVVKSVLDTVGAEIAAGVTTGHLNMVAKSVLDDFGAEALFIGQRMPKVSFPFSAATCISVNEEVIHGVPGERILIDGDIVSVDCGAMLDGWCGDSARTWAVGAVDAISQKLLDATKEALEIAIAEIRPGRKWNRVARQIQWCAERNGLGVVRDYCGHAVGTELHEPPQVYNFVDSLSRKRSKEMDFILQPGLVIAVEPMFTAGTYEVEQCAPGEWPIVTKDRKRSAHFEHTMAVTDDGVIVLSG